METDRVTRETTPCMRCGRRRHVAKERKTLNICQDCRSSDPEYVLMIQGAA